MALVETFLAFGKSMPLSSFQTLPYPRLHLIDQLLAPQKAGLQWPDIVWLRELVNKLFHRLVAPPPVRAQQPVGPCQLKTGQAHLQKEDAENKEMVVGPGCVKEHS